LNPLTSRIGHPDTNVPPVTAASSFVYAGFSDTGEEPADCAISVGVEHVMLAVNSAVAIHGKTGEQSLHRPLRTWFSNVAQNVKIFDPKLIYDSQAARWLLVAVALAARENRSWFLLSVSKSDDPLAEWWNYALDAMLDGTTPTQNWADYPCIGIDQQAIYLSANMFTFSENYSYSKLRILAKDEVYAGRKLQFQDFVDMRNSDDSPVFSLQPCLGHEKDVGIHLVNSVYPAEEIPLREELCLWTLSDPVGSPRLERRTVATDSFGIAPLADQRGSAIRLDAGDVRLHNAVINGTTVWCALTSFVDWGTAGSTAAIHWFAIDTVAGVLRGQGVYGAPGFAYFCPALMPDGIGNMTLLFCRSGKSEYLSVGHAQRSVTDPPDRLRASVLLQSGSSAYTDRDDSGHHRWGDYVGIARDPKEGQRTWLHGACATSADEWSSWFGASDS